MRSLALLAIRRAWLIVAATLVGVAAAAAVGASAESHLTTGGFADPSWDSSRAQQVLTAAFPGAAPNILILATATSGSVSDPPAADAGTALTQRLAAEPGVVSVASFWSPGLPALQSTDGRQALVVGLATGDEDAVKATTTRVIADLGGVAGPLTVTPGGPAVVQTEVVQQSADDLRRAELITFPITALLLLVLFGSAVGASLPLIVGGVAIIGTLCLLRVLTVFTGVSVFALNVTTGLGLGLGVDYSLLIVSRYREELRAGRSGERALVRTLQTAGRTVLFSACTVAVSLAAMAIFPIPFLRSFAYAGTGVVALAAFAAVVVLPAVLHLLGERIEAGRLGRRAADARPGRFWYRRARAVMRQPLLVAAAVLAVLLVMGSPFLRLSTGDDDERILPASAPARVVGDALRTDFQTNPARTIPVVVPDSKGASPDTIAAYAQALSTVDGAGSVDASTGHYARGAQVSAADPASAALSAGTAELLTVHAAVEPLSPQGEDLVRTLRAVPAPFTALVGGGAGLLLDTRDSMVSHLPATIGIIVVATAVLMFLMLGAVLVPLKTLLLNVVSLSATFGALVFVFQDGHLSGLLDFTPTGTISVRTPILLFCFAFGLSMDYEVFLVSRIKEEYDRLHDNDEAVALGLQHTGRLVTSAALLIAVVFAAFVTSGITTIKVIGLGLAIAVLVDAYVVRATLVPALMKLLGDGNWWAPRWLRRLHLRVGIWEREPLAILDVGTPVRLGGE